MEPSPLSGNIRQGSDICGSSDRKDERRVAVAQMMAESGECLGVKVIAILVQRYGVLPRELWDLNSIPDTGAGRGFTYDERRTKAQFKRVTCNSRYSIINLTIRRDIFHKIDLPDSLQRLNILSETCNVGLDLPANLLELMFDKECNYNMPLVLPDNLRKLVLNDAFNLPITFPPRLLELEVGEKYRRPIVLPPRLKLLAFQWESKFDRPIALPPSLQIIRFGDLYNQPTTLPSEVKELWVGRKFTQDLTLPPTLRGLVWCCDRPIQIPEGVSDVMFHDPFNQPVVLSENVKELTFAGDNYSHPVTFPVGLEGLTWHPNNVHDLVLPEGLRRLTWASQRNVVIPLGLEELTLGRHAPHLALPEGLLKFTFDSVSRTYNWPSQQSLPHHYDLPESVEELVMSMYMTFTHPTTLHHLVLECYCCDTDYEGVDLSNHKIHKLTVGYSEVKIKKWPQALKELDFTIYDLDSPMRVPKGCKIVGVKRPRNVTTK